MDGDQSRIVARGADPDVIAPIGREPRLAQGNQQLIDRVAAVGHIPQERKTQAAVQGRETFVEFHQLQRAGPILNGGEPIFFCLGPLVEHDDNIVAVSGFVDLRLGRPARRRVGAGVPAQRECGLGRLHPELPGLVVVGQIVVPDGQRAVADDIARGGVKAQLRRGGGPVAGERHRLAQPIPFRRQPGGREGSNLPLDQGAVVGDGGKGRCDVCTVHQQSGVLQTAALQEADRDKLAPAQIHQSGICLLHKLRLLLGLEGTVQEGHCLGSGAGGLWCEAGLGDAPCHAFFPGPAHRVVVIAVRRHIGEDAVPLLHSRVSGKGVKEAYQRIVTIWALVQFRAGPRTVAEIPVTIPFPRAQSMAA